MSRRVNRSVSANQARRALLGLSSGGKLSEALSQILSLNSGVTSRRDIVTEWFDAYLDAMNAYPSRIPEADDFRQFIFRITGVFSDGLITGQCEAGPDKFLVFANHPGQVPLAGCNCSESNGEYPCKHSFAFLDYVTDILDDSRSWLGDRILSGKFDVKRPDPQQYRFDAISAVRNILSKIAPQSIRQRDHVDESILPPLDETLPTRVVWNVVLKNGQLQVVPTLQQGKKRGGWTKGRKISFESLPEHSKNLSAADRAVRDKVRIDTTYYRPTYHLDSMDALKCLLGQPNVLLNGTPANVELFDAALKLKVAKDCRLELIGQTGQSAYAFSTDCIVRLQEDEQRIQLCELTHQQSECLRAIIRMPSIPSDHKKELIEAAQRLQSVLTVHLPEEFAGKVVEDDYRPAILLRSRADGALDYGIRVRDSSDTLHLAGSGLMLRHAERGGQKIQIARSAAREHQICRRVAEQFGLSSHEHQGTIADFELALQLIEQLQHAETESEIEILWDKSSEQPLRMLGSVSPKNVSVGITRKRDWFQLSGTCNMGEESIELSDLLNGLQAVGADSIRGDFVRLGNRGWAKVSQQFRHQLRQLYDSVNQERGSLKFDATSAPAIRNLLAEQVEMKASQAWNQCLAKLESAEKLEPKLPQGLNAELRDYQVEGFQWLRRLAEWGVGGVLADDMGLGKTLQTLAVILDRASAGPSLVIAPTSVGFNWVREAQRFAPELDVHLYRETDRADFLNEVKPGSLVVCSYGLALRDATALAGVHWTSLVLDEAQAIKNSRSKTSAAIATLPADWKIALTGTPVENHLGELWSLLHVISPGVLGGWEQFRRRFAAPIEKNDDHERRLALRDRLRPFLLRRTKEEVLKDLPPRTEMNLYVEMSPAERAVYDQVRLSAIGEIDELAKLSDVKDQRFRILALLTRLRQLACSPRIVHETWKDRSTKTQLLCEKLLELREEGHRVLVFSQFVQHLSLIREMLDEEQISYEYLDGSTEPKARQQRVDSFQSGDASVFLISLKAGGTGLNLTAADYVIHMDPWWNPAVEDQATDRAHRIGQDKPVMVYRLISQGTIEEEILKLHETKRDLVAGIMEGSQAAGKLSTEDLIALLRG